MAESGKESSSVLDALPTDRLREAAQALFTALTDKAVSAALDQVEDLTGRLTDVAENGGVGLRSALGGGKEALGGGSPVTGAIKGGLSAVKDKAMGALGLGDGGAGGGAGAGGGGRGKFAFMNIVEELDIGVPVRVAYNQWTQYADFPTFMKKVHSVEQESDEKTNWKAQVFWSRRSWSSTTIEQIPDTHIIWQSQGAKGYVNGIVSFHELAPSLTKVLLVMEYYPVGLFEKTGNIWRAVGRRARLEFKHFRRHVMVETLINQEELEGWRGEIRDSEVVRTHEEGLEQERAAEEGYGEYDAEDPDDHADDGYDVEDDDDGEYDDEYDTDDEADDEADDEYDTDDEADDEYDTDDRAVEEEPDDDGDVEDDEPDDEDEGPPARRAPRRPRRAARA